MLRVICSSLHCRHCPKWEVLNGEQHRHYEVPARVDSILRALRKGGYRQFGAPQQFSIRHIRAVHSEAYLGYLSQTSAEMASTNGAEQFVVPSVFPFAFQRQSNSTIARRGHFCFDTYTPILRGTYKSAIEAAFCALTGARIIHQGQCRLSYALCRPVGHHAESARAGGYCYINNAAVAAQYLSQRGKVAVLDIDVHHDNGTQEVFYRRRDVLTVSIHGDPQQLFPYFSGYSDEQGAGLGKGYNLNLPLPSGAGDRAYDTTLQEALSRIARHRPKFLVIALGLDAHKDDPIGNLSLTTEYYQKIAQRINKLETPVLVVQEGGYNVENLGRCVLSFLSGLSIE